MNSKRKITDLIFYITWTVYMITFIFLKKTDLNSLINGENIFNIIEYCVLLILIIKNSILDDKPVRTKIICSVLSIIFIISAIISNSRTLIILIMFVLTFYNINYYKFISYDYILRKILLISVVVLCILGILPNLNYNLSGTTKYGLGFNHPNFLAMFATSLILENLYLYHKEKNIFHILSMICLELIIYYFTKSRTCLYSFMFLILLYLLFKNNKKLMNNKFIKYIILLSPIIFVFISFVLIYLYEYNLDIINILNNFMSRRLSFANNFLNAYRISVFGNNINLISTRTASLLHVKAKVLDMAFVHLLLRYGLLAFIIFTSIIISINYYAYKTKNYIINLINIFFIITSFMETYIFVININFILLSLFPLIKCYKAGGNLNED